MIMAKKSKTYVAKFSPELIQDAHKIFCDCLIKDYQHEITRFDIGYNDERLSFDNEGEFYIQYQKEIKSASLGYTYVYISTATFFTFDLDYYYRSGETIISIELASQKEIDKVFAIFDENYKKPQDTTSVDQAPQALRKIFGLQQSKAYNLKFPAEVIEKAHRVFCSYLEGTTLFTGERRVSFENESKNVDTDDAFYAEYRKDISRAELRYGYHEELYTFSHFNVSYYNRFYQESTDVSITLASQENIEGVFTVFDRYADEYNLAQSTELLNTASKEETLKEPFLLTEDSLIKIDKIFQPFSDAITYKIRCSDNLKREYTNIEQLIQYENPPNRKIESLSISAVSHRRPIEQNAFVLLNSYAISITVKGPEQIVVEFDSGIREWLSGVRPWYAPLIKINLGMKFTAILFSVWLFLLNNSLNELASSDGIIWVSVVAFLIFVVSHLLEYVKFSFFPKADFVLGQGVKRYDDQEKIRWGIIVTFVISFVIGLIFWLIS